MAKYLLAYRGGGGDDSMNDEVMAAWMGWFGSMGDALKDPGNPFVASTALSPGGSRSEASGLSGYSIIEAENLEAAAEAAKGCPLLSAGGTIEVYETMPM
ncbi:MAG TPA: YciI family protein [Acidimicrobiales bacterium]|nr:YciI family protein [Acidimicrobiales bacterium]